MTRRARRTGLTTQQRVFETPLMIGVISDTHIYASGTRELHEAIPDLFQRAGVDLMLHLGDANVRSVLEDLGTIAPLIAVPGNNDELELQYMLAPSVRFKVGTHTFGVVHGHGGRTAIEAAQEMFGESVDLVLYGHSHLPKIHTLGKTIYFNPGSATDRRWHEHFGVGIIRVDEHGIDPELILYGHPEHLRNISFAGSVASDSVTQEPS